MRTAEEAPFIRVVGLPSALCQVRKKGTPSEQGHTARSSGLLRLTHEARGARENISRLNRGPASLFSGARMSPAPPGIVAGHSPVLEYDGAPAEDVPMKLGISISEPLTFTQRVDLAKYCEDHGFDSIWTGEGGLSEDAIVPLALFANATSRVRLGTGIIPNKSRIAPLIAVTFRTLDQVAPGRLMLGLGAWWEPLASSVGTPVKKPIRAMREYITVIRALLQGNTVTFTWGIRQRREHPP